MPNIQLNFLLTKHRFLPPRAAEERFLKRSPYCSQQQKIKTQNRRTKPNQQLTIVDKRAAINAIDVVNKPLPAQSLVDQNITCTVKKPLPTRTRTKP